jgi:hypothetical protein
MPPDLQSGVIDHSTISGLTRYFTNSQAILPDTTIDFTRLTIDNREVHTTNREKETASVQVGKKVEFEILPIFHPSIVGASYVNPEHRIADALRKLSGTITDLKDFLDNDGNYHHTRGFIKLRKPVFYKNAKGVISRISAVTMPSDRLRLVNQ